MNIESLIKFEKLGMMDKALEELKDINPVSNDEILKAIISKNRILVCVGNFEEAKRISQELEPMLSSKKISLDLERLLYMALSYYFQDKFEECGRVLKMINDKMDQNHLDRTNFDPAGASLFNAMFPTVSGFYCEAKGDFTKSLDFLNKAREEYNKYGYKYYVSVIYGHLGKVHQYMGDYELAKANYELEKETASQTKDIHRLKHAIQDLGSLYWRTNQKAQALEDFKEALMLSEKEGTDFYYGELLFSTILLSLEMNEEEPPLDLINKLLNHSLTSTNHMDNVRYKIVDALVLKAKKRIIDLAKAQESMRMVLKEQNLSYELNLLSISILISLLLEELKVYSTEEVLKEVNSLLNDLENTAKKQELPNLLIDSLILQSKLEMIKGNISNASNILLKAKNIALEKNIEPLVNKINTEQKMLEDEFMKWKEMIDNNKSLAEKVEYSQFKEYLSNAIEIKNLLDKS